jgi:hypothetical protein
MRDRHRHPADVVSGEPHSPVCSPCRTEMPSSSTPRETASAHWMPRAGPSNVAMKPSPIALEPIA